MVDVIQELGHLTKLAKGDSEKRFNRLYRLLRQPEFLMLARTKIQRNKGANTPGVDGQVMKDITPEVIVKLTQELAAGTYSPQPVRRVYIPKKNNIHSLRPLGIPTSRDKVVQAGVALILEALYEPVFRNSSHGFRPGRSPITALRRVATAYRAGGTWIIEGDLANCFGSIPHHVILNCLRKRICDERFIDVIRRMLKAGVMEMVRYQPTYSGTPQGGVATPATMLQTAPFGAQIKRVGCYPEYDIDFFFANLNPFDQCPNEFTFGGPIGLGQAAADLQGELF
jgi:RNA-directed DNA polymerase